MPQRNKPHLQPHIGCTVSGRRTEVKSVVAHLVDGRYLTLVFFNLHLSHAFDTRGPFICCCRRHTAESRNFSLLFITTVEIRRRNYYQKSRLSLVLSNTGFGNCDGQLHLPADPVWPEQSRHPRIGTPRISSESGHK